MPPVHSAVREAVGVLETELAREAGPSVGIWPPYGTLSYKTSGGHIHFDIGTTRLCKEKGKMQRGLI